jgi:hypothetical protein
MSRIFLKEEKVDENVIMQNDEFALIEESDYFHDGDTPENGQGRTSANTQSPSVNDDIEDEDRELSDEEMEKLFDKIEQEEQENRGEEDDKKHTGTDTDDARDTSPPEKKR